MGGRFPQGIEVLIRKASVDPAFRAMLLERCAAAAQEIGLALGAAEAGILAAVPAEQLEAIIRQTSVPQEHRRAFLGQAAAAMLAAIAAMPAGLIAAELQAPGGVRPNPTPALNSGKTVEDRVMAIMGKYFPPPPVLPPNVPVAGVMVQTAPNPRKRLLWEAGKPKTDPRMEKVRKDIEKEFGIKLSSWSFRKLNTMADLIRHVGKATGAKAVWTGWPPTDEPDPGPQPPQSAGIRPGVPPTRGIQPDRP